MLQQGIKQQAHVQQADLLCVVCQLYHRRRCCSVGSIICHRRHWGILQTSTCLHLRATHHCWSFIPAVACPAWLLCNCLVRCWMLVDMLNAAEHTLACLHICQRMGLPFNSFSHRLDGGADNHGRLAHMQEQSSCRMPSTCIS